ncbi:biotin--[acetyl-CoA-carboxylase] ligase [Vulcanibacillus modesticaldus]|uniref:Bifunctional ligase/repressor BirA n=1 Tax=Vulcanibacillus modesticaldus TaxID=337097 RepID=A0A1D2YXF2_9BACI|nr:biotin--[acetyl-CoA-carboxylase] ligase [Vulcanibacillus modesticaldus]OEG00333.1 biotin--[acetyl-CoA-carboxylase] ligase [Vulcanibacillus modesticaldus]
MKEKIKEIFLNSDHRFISGEELSKRLQISRTAIWKQIEGLRKEGYKFEAVRKKGYRLINNPDDIYPERIKQGLSTKWLGKDIVYRHVSESTQLEAHNLARQGVEHGTIIIANEQTNGRGRLGRKWYSEKGKGIFMSMILRPNFDYEQISLITLLTSIIIFDSLKNVYGITSKIKWPNDIYIDDRKCAGILSEIHGEQDQIHYLIIGIGINTHKTEYPVEIESKAISIEEKIDGSPNRVELITEILNNFELGYERFIELGFTAYFDQYNNLLYGKEKKVIVTNFNRKVIGLIEGVNQNGHLLIKKEDGSVKEVVSGVVEFI